MKKNIGEILGVDMNEKWVARNTSLIVLPLPPTDNRLRTIGWGTYKLVKSPEYRRWEEKCAHIWNDKYNFVSFITTPSYDNQIKICYRVFLDNKRKDIGNFEKALKDFLSKRLYPDDKWVVMDLLLPVTMDKENPRIEIIY